MKKIENQKNVLRISEEKSRGELIKELEDCQTEYRISLNRFEFFNAGLIHEKIIQLKKKLA